AAGQSQHSYLVKLDWTLASSRQTFASGANQGNIAWTGVAAPDVQAPTPDDREHRIVAHLASWTADEVSTPGWRRGWRADLLDRQNVADVYLGTGRPDDTGWLQTAEGQDYLSASGARGVPIYELAQHDPAKWESPRTFTLSLLTRW